MLATLSGQRVLVVEDEYFIAEELAAALVSLGASILGPAATIERALDLLDSGQRCDLAVLDINLKGESSFELARILTVRGVPYVFATGYDEAAVPPGHEHVPRWEKPFDTQALAAALAGLPENLRDKG
jgi:DNA-binding LytR/AlgR family response regulator